jgi:hypothetical protein
MMPLCLIPWLKRYRPISGEQVATKMVLVSQQSGAGNTTFCLDEIFIT